MIGVILEIYILIYLLVKGYEYGGKTFLRLIILEAVTGRRITLVAPWCLDWLLDTISRCTKSPVLG
jgi:hypothetical protein